MGTTRTTKKLEQRSAGKETPLPRSSAAPINTNAAAEAPTCTLPLAPDPSRNPHGLECGWGARSALLRQAMWEGGAAALGRVDELVGRRFAGRGRRRPGDQVFPVVEAALARLSPIELKLELPRPTWHGHAQTFYRLRDASPYLLLDFVVMKASAEEKFLDPETHGQVVVHFDKTGVIRPRPTDPAAVAARLRSRIETLATTFELFRILTWKEIHRRHDLEAMAYYQSFTLRPLVELLRIVHCPERHGFFARYVDHDLPAALVAQLRPLFFVGDLDGLRQAQETAERLFAETARGLAG